MIEITVGYVAGIIAAAIVFAQIWCPTAIALVLAGLLRDTETVATWNIASRVLQRTWWPTILQSDSVQSHGARLKITLVSWSVPIIAVLIAITGVVTPLGLYEEMDMLDSKAGTFSYVRDTGSFGAATSQRGLHNFSRTCSWGHGMVQGPAPCPYSGNSVIVTGSNGTFNFSMPDGYSSKLNPIVREIFSSGTRGRTTISNFFDIEWRQITTKAIKFIDNGTDVPVGAYRQLESHIMDPSIKVVEGLIVDAKNGGIGLRNHTVPTNVEQGASWTEDLLFIEPIASCVNTNLTLDFDITLNSTNIGGITNFRLTDRGGFIKMNQTYPAYDHDNAQSNPDLRARAYKAAWINNAWTMMYFNVTTGNNETTGAKAFDYLESEIGKEFPLQDSSLVNYRALGLSAKFGNYLDLLGSSISRNKAANWTNPFGVTTEDFKQGEVICSGAGARDFANISNIYVGCGLLRGAPERVDSGAGSSFFENHSKWSSSLHTCAAAVRAVVKTVTFTVNGTDGLTSLKVTSIDPKNYTSPDDYPLWGLEDSGLTLDGISPVWGIISPEYATRPNISTVKQPAFHMPGYTNSLSSSPLGVLGGITGYNLPGSDFPSDVMQLLFSGGSSTDGSAVGGTWPFDLAGAANMPIFNRWQSLSKDADTVSDVIKLIWTDLAASAVVGTKGVLGSGNGGTTDEAVQVAIQPYGRRIKYRYAFGIPAFITLLAMLSIAAVLLVTAIFSSSTVGVLRQRLQQLTVGRILTTLLYPDNSNLFMSSKAWSQANGDKSVLMDGVPQKTHVTDKAMHGQYPPRTPGTPLEEINVGLMGGDRKPGY